LRTPLKTTVSLCGASGFLVDFKNYKNQSYEQMLHKFIIFV
jgi:hypothetical protein